MHPVRARVCVCVFVRVEQPSWGNRSRWGTAKRRRLRIACVYLLVAQRLANDYPNDYQVVAFGYAAVVLAVTQLLISGYLSLDASLRPALWQAGFRGRKMQVGRRLARQILWL